MLFKYITTNTLLPIASIVSYSIMHWPWQLIFGENLMTYYRVFGSMLLVIAIFFPLIILISISMYFVTNLIFGRTKYHYAPQIFFISFFIFISIYLSNLERNLVSSLVTPLGFFIPYFYLLVRLRRQ